jgi:DNA-dependent RNA polymerase auxiliary subunit epsilon
MKYPAMPHREPTTTITVGVSTAEKVRRLVGEMQLKTGKTVTQRMVIEAALGEYTKKLKEERK